MSTIGIEDPGLYASFPAAVTPTRGARAKAVSFERLLTTAEIALDAVAVFLSVVGAYWAYSRLHLGVHAHYPLREVTAMAVGVAAMFVLLLDRDGAYRQDNSLLRIKETERVLRVSVQATLLVFPVSFFSARMFPRLVMALAAATAPVMLVATKQVMFTAVRVLHAHGWGVRRVVIYGAGVSGRRVFSALCRSPKLGLAPVVMVDDDPARAGEEVFELSYRRNRSVPVVLGPVTAALLRERAAQVLVVTDPLLSREKLLVLAHEAAAASARVYFLPATSAAQDAWIDHVDVDGLLLAAFSRPAEKVVYEAAKRAFDVVAALLALLIAAPLWCALAVMIRWSSPGPVLFRQERVGRDGRRFEIFKFRTMYVDAPRYDYHPSNGHDPRITPFGRWLRRTSLDELPQLLNVLRGEMSLVGPRPEMPFIVERYSSRERRRLAVLPGITGLWQLSADRAFLIHENIQYDFYYIRNRSFFMDMAILMHTVIFAARGI